LFDLLLLFKVVFLDLGIFFTCISESGIGVNRRAFACETYATLCGLSVIELVPRDSSLRQRTVVAESHDQCFRIGCVHWREVEAVVGAEQTRAGIVAAAIAAVAAVEKCGCGPQG